MGRALENGPQRPEYGHVDNGILWLIFRKKRSMKRIFLFVVTNLAVLALLGLVVFIIERVSGVRLGQGGAAGLLVFAAIFGFGGALISLALSKWTAKRLMGVRVITQPRSDSEAWLLGTVAGLAAKAGGAPPR